MSWEFIRQFCEKPNFQDGKPLLRLWQNEPTIEGAKRLLKCFGKLQANKISEYLSPEQKIFKDVIEEQSKDFHLLLKNNKKFILGEDKRKFIDDPEHSWNRIKSCANTKLGKQHAQELCDTYLEQEPMPLLSAQALGLNPELIDKKFKDLKNVMDALTKTLFMALKKPPPSKGLLDAPLLNSNKITQFELMLLKFAAVNEDDHLNSWLDEMLLWGTGNYNVIPPILRQFKVCHLMGSATTRFFKLRSPPFKSIPKGVNYDDSFHDYLIKKTLDQIISFCPIPDATYKEVLEEFRNEDGESNRQLVCFYFYLLKRLFIYTDSALPYCSTKILSARGPHKPLADQAFSLLNRICPEESIVKNFLILMTHAFAFEYQSKKEMTKKTRAELFNILFRPLFSLEELKPVLDFVLNILPSPTHLPLLTGLNHKKDAVAKKVFAVLNKMILIFNTCQKEFLDPQEPFLDEIKSKLNQLHLKTNTSLYLNILDYLHALFYIDLTEETKELLYNRLLEANESEKEQYRKELTAYGESLEFSGKISMHKNRQNYFKKIYSEFLDQQKEEIPEFSNVLNKWPNSFKKFDTNVKLIQELRDFLKENLPIRIFINFLLYPVFLSPFLDHLRTARSLQEEISKIEENFFIPPSLIKKIKELAAAIQESKAFISNISSGGEHAKLLPTHLSNLSHLIQLALLPATTYRIPIMESCELFSKTKGEVNHVLFQNLLFPLIGADLQKTFCLSNWDLSDEFPVLDLTFIRSTKNYASRKHSFTLEMDKKELSNPSLKNLLKMAFYLCDEVEDESWENRLSTSRSQTTSGMELEWSCAISKEFNEAYEKCLCQDREDTIKKVKIILKFVKAIKIFARTTLSKFKEPDQGMTFSAETPLTDFVKEGNVYNISTGLALIPHSLISMDKEEKFQLRSFQFKTEFKDLCGNLLKDTESLTKKLFCELTLEGETYPVELILKRHDLSNADINPEFKRNYQELKFILRTIPPIQLILTLPEVTSTEQEDPTNPNFSRLKGFSNGQELENFLRWGFLSLIGKYYIANPTKPKPLENRTIARLKGLNQTTTQPALSTRSRSQTLFS